MYFCHSKRKTYIRIPAGRHMRPTGNPPKSLLTCPECGYESRAESGWLRYTLPGGRRVQCPVCFEVIDRRASDWSLAGAWRDHVEAGLTLWSTGLARWRRSGDPTCRTSGRG